MKFNKMLDGVIGKFSSYMLLKIFAYFVALISVPILSNILSANLYGEILLLDSNVNLLASIFVLGLPQAYIRYYYNAERMGQVETYDYNYLLLVRIVLILSFFITVVYCWLFVNNDIKIVVCLALIVSINISFQDIISMFRSRGRVYLHSFLLGAGETAGYIIPLFTVILMGKSSLIYFNGQLVANIILVMTVIILAKQYYNKSKVDISIIKKLLIYGAPLLLLSLGVSLFGNVDRIIIGYLYGNDMVAYYSVPSKIAHVIQQILIYPINMILFPYYIKLWENKGKETTERFLSQALELYLFISIPLIVGAFIIDSDLIRLLSNSDYSKYAIIFPILLIALLIYGSYYFVAAGFHLEGKTLLLGITMFFSAVINLILNYILGSIYGIIGIGIATGISYIVFLYAGYKFSKNILKIRLQKTLIFQFILCALLMGGISEYVGGYFNGILKVIVVTVVGGVLYSILNFKYIRKVFKILGDYMG